MDQIFNLIRIQERLASDEAVEDTIDGITIRRLYIGTVFDLVPSGKIYTPYAHSNVTEEEAELDQDWYEEAEAELEGVGAYLENGEGDPCDLFVVQEVD